MKFLGVALAALLGLAEGKRSISASQMKTRLANGEFNKQTLMANSKPYGNTARKLEEGEEFEINGLYSVQFNSCVSMTIQDENVLSDDLISYSATGALVAEKSYILFSVCYTENCYYQAEDDKMTFITDLATFFQSFVDFLPNQVENYCEGCQQNADYCSGALAAEYAQADQDEAADEDAAEDADEDADQDADEDQEDPDEENEEDPDEDEDQDGEPDDEGEDEPEDGEEEGDRKLANKRKLANQKSVQYIDCDMCNTYECFAEDNEVDDAVEDYVFEDALEWIQDFSECKELEYNDDLALFAGLICNEQGNGVEIGVFFDEDCTQHATKMSYQSMMSYADQQYFALSEEVVEYMFTNDFSCYQEEIEYTNPYEEAADEDEDAEEDNGEAPEAAEWCQGLFDGELEAVNLYDCGVDADAENDNEAEYDENIYNYDFYSYQLSENQYDDASEVCQVLKGTDGKTTVYSNSNAGSLYTYKPNNSSGSGMGTGWIIVLVVLIAGALGAAATVVFKRKSNSKRDPLISTADGTLA
eukprot:Nitzschia sp. Nitz4//scaffold15_size197535//97848//99519//NITZ4_001582-RA/size197535-augustus-gene-0.225-mRNA-1//-1//CDS//3329537727//683//frame0